MKIHLPIIFLLCILVSAAHAQLFVGPVAGGQLSWTRFDNHDLYDTYSVKPVWGFHAGATVSLKVRNRFFLHGSLLYSTKGRNIEGKDDPLLHNKATYNFIEIPLVYAVDFRGKFGKSKEFKYYLGAGPNISYWLGGRGKIYNSDLAESTEFSQSDLSYRIVFKKDPAGISSDEMNVADPNRVQLGLNIASGLVFEPVVNQKILVMIRYELGHSFLSRSSNGTFTSTYYQDVLQSRNQGVRISVSYLVDLRIDDRKKGKSTIRKSKV
jgi:hypothetical protein